MIVTLLKPLVRVRSTVAVGTELDLPWALANSLIKKRMAKVKKASKKDQRRVLGAEATAAAADKADKAKRKAAKAKSKAVAKAEKQPADKADNA